MDVILKSSTLKINILKIKIKLYFGYIKKKIQILAEHN